MMSKPAASSCSSSNCIASNSDEEVLMLLAPRRPKKPAGRKKFKETRHPVYRGVRRRGNGKWVCELREPTEQKRIWLGTYPTPEMAAVAHDVAALALRGHLATLNFTDSAWRLPVPESNDVKDIRKAAVAAAAGLRGLIVAETTTEGKVVEEEVQSTMRVEIDEVVDDTGDLWTPCLIGDEIKMMAESVLFSPAACMQLTGRTSFSYWDQVELETDQVEVSLWSYSI